MGGCLCGRLREYPRERQEREGAETHRRNGLHNLFCRGQAEQGRAGLLLRKVVHVSCFM